MKKLFPTLILLYVSISAYSQTHFRFSIDDVEWFAIKENADGYRWYHQSNISGSLNHTSTYFGFNVGAKTIKDPAIFLSGSSNTGFGFNALAENTSGFQNTAIGSGALDENTTGFTNVAVGSGALSNNETGTHNIALGHATLRDNLDADFNIGIGHTALVNNESGTRNIVIGHSAGSNDVVSNDNVYIGDNAARGAFTAASYTRSQNTIIGSYAGLFNSTSGNVFLGYRAGQEAAADNQLYIANSEADSTEALIYGDFGEELLRVNGELTIDGLYTLPTSAPSAGQFLRVSSNTTNPTATWSSIDLPWQFGAGDDCLYEDGDVGIGTGNAIYRLDVQDNLNNGYVARFRNSNTSTTSKGIIIQTGPNVNPNSSVYYALFLDGNGTNIGGIRGNGAGGTLYSTTSDRRLKQNISTYTAGLQMVENIRPTTYQMKSNPDLTEIGFIAQELKEVLPTAVGGDESGDPNTDPMTVDYSKLTPVLVSAIQEQQKQIQELKELVLSQSKDINTLKAEVEKVKGLAQN